jgi:aminopeptidase N
MLRQMRRWSIEQSPQGPVYLGYRLGHIKAEGRIFRAIVYNKGAMVLHMLRRLLGDEKFFEGIRQFYATWKFRKAGTDDFRVAMQKASGTDLTAFFDGWVYGASVPVLGFSSTVSGGEARIRFEHRGVALPTPVTVSITYADGTSEDVMVPVAERVVERTIELRGAVRTIEANRDYGAVAEIEK